MTSNATPIIEFKGVNKWYASNGYHVLRDVNLQFAKGEKVVICGPSGSGKSTLIRCINALEEYQEGTLTVDGTLLGDDLKGIDKVRREVGMVFQQFNLFPHLTVMENLILSPTWVAKMPRKEAIDKAMVQLERVRIAEHANKYPSAVVWRSAAARGHCPCAVPDAQDHAVR
jgi:general L-amino acid transport system ATP-binding protein